MTREERINLLPNDIRELVKAIELAALTGELGYRQGQLTDDQYHIYRRLVNSSFDYAASYVNADLFELVEKKRKASNAKT